MAEDRNLLFGVMAVQLKFISPQSLMEAAAGWAVHKKNPLKDYLVEVGLITAEAAGMIEALLEEQVKIHSGDVRATLASFGGERAVQESFAASSVLVAGNKLESFGGVSGRPEDVTPRATAPGFEEGPLSEDQLLEDAKSLTLEHPGRYSIQREHSRGGIGRVMLAFDAHIGREIAVKELIPERHAVSLSPERSSRRSQAILSRFLREARITGQLEHPAVVPVYEVGRRPDGSIYYTMKFVRGKTLAQALAESKGPADRLRLLTHFLNLCHAVAYAHHRKVIHRDIKPHNVMVGEFGETVVIDWGLAKVRGRRDDRLDSIEKEIKLVWDGKGDETIKGSPVGTPAYMSPEQAEGKLEMVDERSDIWSLGAVLYEILTGKIPFDGVNAYEIMGKVVKDEPPPVLELEPSAPPELAAVAHKCLNKSPGQRYQSAEDLAKDIENFLTGRLVSVYQYPFSELFKRWLRRWWPVTVSVAAAAAALILVFVWSYVKIAEEKNHALLNIAQAYAAYGEWAEAEQRWGIAELFYAKSLLMADQPKTRYAMNFAHTVPEVPLRSKYWLSAGGGGISDLEINREGTMLAVGGEDKIIWLWDLGDGQLLHTLRGHTAPVTALAFSSDGRFLASAGEDATVRLWEVDSARQLYSFTVPTPHTRWLAFNLSGRLLAAAGDSPVVQVWDTQSGAEIWKQTAHEKEIRGLAFSPDGRLLATWSKDQTVRIWEMPEGKAAAVLKGHVAVVLDAAFFPDGGRMISASWDKTVKVWDLSGGTAEKNSIATYSGPAPARFVRLAPDGQAVLVGYDNGAVQLLDTAGDALSLLQTWKAHPASLAELSPFPDLRTFATCGGDQMIRLWSIYNDQPANAVKVQMQTFGRLAVSPLGNLLVFAGDRPPLRVFTTEDKDSVKRYHALPGKIWQVKSEPEGRFIAISGRDGESVKILDLRSEEMDELSVNHADGICSLAISADGKYLVTGSWDKTVGVWNIKSGQPLYDKLTGPQDKVWSVVIVPGAERQEATDSLIAAGGNDPVIWVWKLLTGDLFTKLIGHTDKVRALAVSPTKKLLASAGLDSKVLLWQLDKPAPISPLPLEGHTAGVGTLAFSPDGKLLASAGLDKTVRVWEVDHRRLLYTLPGHEKWIRSVQFSRDGMFLISAGEDSVVKIWEVKTGRLLHSLAGTTDSLRSVALRPDFGVLAVGSADHLIRLWDPATGKLIHVLSGHPGSVEQLIFSGASYLISADDQGEVFLWPILEEFFRKTPAELYRQTQKETGFSVQDMEVVPWEPSAGK